MNEKSPSTIRVRVFAAARELAGREAISVQLPGGANVGGLRGAMVGRCPQLCALVKRSLIAIDAEYAAENRVVPPTADVACIPPVSGG